MAKIRMDKFLADAGLGTRSKVKEFLKNGSITVNDVVIKKGDVKVDTEIDIVKYMNKEISYSEFEYYMLNKPAGVVSATKDNRDKTVLELIDTEKRRDLFPVGRLDKDTEGLLLITNDGVLANNLLAPGKHVDKTYYAKISGRVDDSLKAAFLEGVDIGDEKPTKPAELEIISCDDISEIRITITEGRYHQIKRMFEAYDLEVVYLKRLSMGSLKLDAELAIGDYRKLTDAELKALKER